MGKYLVWCPDINSAADIEDPIEANTEEEAASAHLDELDSGGEAFPDNENGDTCNICVADWPDLDDDETLDEDSLDYKTYTFKLHVDRRIELA